MTSSHPCTVDGCLKTHYALGYCRPHYVRYRKHGDPQANQAFQVHMIGATVEERLWTNIDRSDDKTVCWPWTALSKHRFGYGQLWNQERTHLLSAHRTAWQVTHGPIPSNLNVLHACDIPACCNPTILLNESVYGSHRGRIDHKQELTIDGVTLQFLGSGEILSSTDWYRTSKEFKDKGITQANHLFLGTQADNVRDAQIKGRSFHGALAKLSEDDVREIRKLASQGLTQPEIASRFGIHRGHAGRIVRRDIWKHVS